jgi:alpha-glucoside transport system substrate-binding protein
MSGRQTGARRRRTRHEEDEVVGMRQGKAMTFGAGALALALTVTACGDGGDADRAEGDLAGMTVQVLGGFVAPADEAFREAAAVFEEQTGASVQYRGSADFPQLVTTQVGGGNPPDIAMIPQPGLLEQFVEEGSVRPLDDIVDLDELQQTLVPGLIDVGTFDGAYYGLPRVVALKSSVWYPPAAFDEAGYEVPETWAELEELTEQIQSTADTNQAPWCLGIESSGATGWVVTDWLEDILLRTAGPAAYDAWVVGDLPFDSPEVREAAEVFEDLVLAEGRVLGGAPAILSTPYGDAPLPLFQEDPACLLHRQASFISGFFPAGYDDGEEVDVFYLPPMEDGFDGRPVLGSGDLAALFTDNPAAEEFMRFMTDPEWLGAQIDTGFDFSPFQTFPIENYPSATQRAQAQYLAEADVFRFDASDQMPAEVGAGTFWRQMVEWINGEATLDEALQAIDASWPED